MTSLPFAPEVDLVAEFNRLRDDQPICQVTMPSGDQMWLVSRHEDVKRLYTDPRFSREMPPGTPRQLAEGDWSDSPGTMSNMEGARHAARRGPVLAHLTPRKIEALRAPTAGIARRLLDEMVAAGPPAEFIESFAAPMPTLSAAVLAGVPESDYDFFRRDTVAIVAQEQYTGAEIAEATRQVYEYTYRLAEAKRAQPGEDMTTDIVRAADEGVFPADELPVVLMEIMYGGMINTRCVIASGLLVLLRSPELYGAVAADDEFAVRFTEETLRCFGHPSTGLPRLALEDVELGGVLIAKGEAVVPSLTAANRDPAVFADPDQFDPARPGGQHVTFGHGKHHCAGSALIRMHLQVAFTEITRRLPTLRLNGEPTWRRTVIDHGPARMPVAW